MQCSRHQLAAPAGCADCLAALHDVLEDTLTTTERIKAKTGHLKGVKIAIMGCIVNGPGEMADADFGYVGSGPGTVNLFVGHECVERHVPAAHGAVLLTNGTVMPARTSWPNIFW